MSSSTARRRAPLGALIICASLACSGFAAAGERQRGNAVPAAFMALMEQSMNDKTGLTFFIDGQALPAVVTKINDDHTVEGRSQQYDRIVIRLRRVQAIAK